MVLKGAEAFSQRSGELLDNILANVNSINERNGQISEAATRQNVVTESVNENVNSIYVTSQAVSQDAEAVRETSNSLALLSTELIKELRQFKV